LLQCVLADTPTLNSVEVYNEGFESERDSTLEAAKSLAFIEVVERDSTFRGSVTAGEIFVGAWERDVVSIAPSTPLAENGCVASNSQM